MKNTYRFIEEKMIQRNYSKSTISTYIGYLKKYSNYCRTHSLDPKEDAIPFIQYLIKQGYSVSAQNQAINAIKYYWENILNKERTFIEIERPMKERKLPEVLSLEEVNSLFNVCRNFKHLMILKTIYACGLRISELVNLEIQDINNVRNTLKIRQGKGKKDRIVPIPEELLVELRQYYRIYKPFKYLFEGQGSTEEEPQKYSTGSIQKTIKRLSKSAGIRRRITPHTLRHSYATHLYEHGISLRSIQVLLGHESSRTTEIYTRVTNAHISNTPSPLNFLKKNENFKE